MKNGKRFILSYFLFSVLLICFAWDVSPPLKTGLAAESLFTSPLLSDAEISRQVEVPILMYHHIADPPPRADAIRRDLSLSPGLFEAHLRYLVEAGYQPITLRQLASHLLYGEPLPPCPIVLTFDDGYRDHYTQAYPLLKEYGFVGTFFLVTGPIDWGNNDYLTWEQVEIMSAGGMEFGDHSYDHKDLKGKSFDFVTWQIMAPKDAIEKHTGQKVLFFCYPSGSYDQQVIDVLRSAGFLGGVTTMPGVLHSKDRLFHIRRIRVRGGDSLAKWIANLNEAISDPPAGF